MVRAEADAHVAGSASSAPRGAHCRAHQGGLLACDICMHAGAVQIGVNQRSAQRDASSRDLPSPGSPRFWFRSIYVREITER